MDLSSTRLRSGGAGAGELQSGLPHTRIGAGSSQVAHQGAVSERARRANQLSRDSRTDGQCPGSCLVMPARRFDALATMEAIQEERCTALYGVPTMFIAQLHIPRFRASISPRCARGSWLARLVPSKS